MASAGPPCGWVVTYIELLMSEYRLSLSQVFRLPVPVGSELLEARINRLHPDLGRNSYMDRAIVAARNACRRDLLKRFRLDTGCSILDSRSSIQQLASSN